MSDTIHILCATFNGARWLPEFIASVQAQTHRDWHLWFKDDGSTDDTRAIIAAAAAHDPARISVHHDAPVGLGAAASFAWLWDALDPAAPYVAFADQDDVWMPQKLARSLAVLRDAERDTAGPVLVHTDLVVVDDERREIAPSFVRYAGVPFGDRPLRHAVIWNGATGCTMLLNRALRHRAGPMPADVPMHDWWIACVAAAVGRTVALDEPTLWYRQHATNAVGAHAQPTLDSVGDIAHASWRALGRTTQLRTGIAAVAKLASLLMARFADEVRPTDRAMLAQCARIPSLPWLARKRALARHYWLPERAWIRNLGIVLRG